MNDPETSDVRRDRAAQVLASIELRSGQIPVGKKAKAERSARWSGYGGPWWELLHTQSERAEMEAELAADPGLRAQVLAQAAEARAREREMEAGRAQYRHEARRTIDDVLAERDKHIAELPPTDDWSDDLWSTPRVPGERLDPNVPPDDE